MFSSASPISGAEISLSEQKIWNDFYPKTEMIVTKKKGRVIFPHLNYNVKGLDPGTLYSVFIHLERVDGIKYKFDAAKWKEAGPGEPILPVQYKEHPDGARSGEHWMKEVVSFSHLKITNDPQHTDAKLILVQSMHKYLPVVTIRKVGELQGEEFRIQATEFVVVTAYQSEDMIQLKVSHNKFASGFRSNGKRRNSSDSDGSTPEAKRSSTSTSSSTSSQNPSPLTVSPSIWDPNMFYGTQNTIPMVQNPGQFFDFTAGNQFYWNQYYAAAGNPAAWNPVSWNPMNQWTMNSDPNTNSGFQNM